MHPTRQQVVRTIALFAVATLLLLPSPVTAHSKDYVTVGADTTVLLGSDVTAPCKGCGVPNPVLDCNDHDGVDDLSFGGVCFEAGHVARNLYDPLERGAIYLVDDAFNPVGAVYCQDLDGDGLCGGSPLDDPEGLGRRAEPYVRFCNEENEVILIPPVDEPGLFEAPALRTPDEWARHVNWEDSLPVLVFVESAVQGNFLLNVCGYLLTPGTHGSADHS